MSNLRKKMELAKKPYLTPEELTLLYKLIELENRESPKNLQHFSKALQFAYRSPDRTVDAFGMTQAPGSFAPSAKLPKTPKKPKSKRRVKPPPVGS